jgi:predicted RNA-binding Zn ribbon-like protein
MPDTKTLFDRWRAADLEAHKLERALLVDALHALQTGGTGPTDEQRQSARTLREIANALLKEAMAELTTVARGPFSDPHRGH